MPSLFVGIGGTILIAAAGVLAALHRWLAKLNQRLDITGVTIDNIRETINELKDSAIKHDRRLKRVADIVLVELSANDGKSTRDKVEHIERLVTLLDTDK